jgi:hypothetical protein
MSWGAASWLQQIVVRPATAPSACAACHLIESNSPFHPWQPGQNADTVLIAV